MSEIGGGRMTATERLRGLLDERGVEWWNDTDPEPQNVTMARAGGQLIAYHENANGSIGYHVCNTHDLTPEQAIAATLGSCNCSNSERTGAPRLPHFWTHDGVLHIEATRMPTRIVVCEGGTCEFVPKRELDASEAENAKLRELVKALLTCATDGDCDECRLNGATPWHVGKAQLCDGVWDRLRELGVEVDDVLRTE